MINSIQSYQNTPKLTSNKTKANNSPNFGMEFDYVIKTNNAKRAIETMLIHTKSLQESNGFLTAITNWAKEVKNLVKPIGEDAYSAKFEIDSIDTQVPGISGYISISKDGKRTLNNDRINIRASMTKDEELYLDPQAIRIQCENLLKMSEKRLKSEKNASSEIKAGEEILNHVSIQS